MFKISQLYFSLQTLSLNCQKIASVFIRNFELLMFKLNWKFQITFIKRNIMLSLPQKFTKPFFDGSKLGWKYRGREFLGKVLTHGVFHFADYVIDK